MKKGIATVPCSLIIMHLLPHMPVYTLVNEEVGRDVRQWKEIVCTCGGGGEQMPCQSSRGQW